MRAEASRLTVADWTRRFFVQDVGAASRAGFTTITPNLAGRTLGARAVEFLSPSLTDAEVGGALARFHIKSNALTFTF